LVPARDAIPIVCPVDAGFELVEAFERFAIVLPFIVLFPVVLAFKYIP